MCIAGAHASAGTHAGASSSQCRLADDSVLYAPSHASCSHSTVLQVVRSVDVALLDACFNDASELPGRDMRLVPHPLVTDTLARLQVRRRLGCVLSAVVAVRAG